MATTEEIVAKYRLDLDDLKKQVNELQGELGKVDKKAGETSGNVDKAFGKLNDKLKDLGKAVVAAFAVERIVAFGKASVQAFAESEAGALKLRAAVSAQGGLQKDFENLNNQAEDLAAITIFDDDTIKAAQTQALQFGLNAKAVEKLIPVVADFAAATGQDLTSALQATIGGINGQERALKAYGVTLDGTSNRNERLSTIIEQLTGKFNGQAQALTETLGGSIGQAEKAFGELQETIGKALAPAIIEASTAVTQLFNSFQAPPEQPIIDEITALEKLRVKVLDVNTTQDDRNVILADLQRKYPGYLDNLQKDKVSNEDLNKALNKVTNELLDQLVIRQQSTKVAEKQAAINTANALVAQREADTAELLVKARLLGINVEDRYTTTVDRARRAIELLDAKAGSANLAQKVQLRGIAQELTRTALGVGTFSTGLVQAYEQVKVAEKELDQQQKTRTDVLRELGLSAQNYRKIETDALRDLIAGGDELAAQEMKRRDLQVEVDKMTLEQFTKLSAARKKEIETVLETTADAIIQAKKTGLEGLTEEEQRAADEKAKATREAAEKARQAAEKQAADELKIRQELAKGELAQDQQNLATYDAERRRAIEARYNQEEQASIAAAQAAQERLLADLQAGLITWEQYEKQKAEISAQVANRDPERRRALLEQDIATLKLQIQNRKDYGQDATELETQLADKQAALQNQITTDEQAASQQRLTNAEKEAQEKLRIAEAEAAQRKKLQELAYQDAVNLVNQLFELSNTQLEQDLAAAEARQAAQQEQADAEQARLDEQLKSKIISQQQYEQQRQLLDQERAKSEQRLAAETARIKRKQDANAKLQAIFRLGIDTAAAIVAQLREVPLPAGAPLLALLGGIAAAQLAAILAAKPPQYAEGIDWVPLGKNRRGRDTIPAMLDEGERVIPRRQNLKHWDLYQAIDEDRLPQYIFNKYTAPALEKERASGGALARAMSQSLSVQQALGSTTSDPSELRRLWRRGLAINNLDELAELLQRNQPSPYRN